MSVFNQPIPSRNANTRLGRLVFKSQVLSQVNDLINPYLIRIKEEKKSQNQKISKNFHSRKIFFSSLKNVKIKNEH
ncbi:hypothetical protein BpHYR1_035096 [Brachionus plicatilis]|uniref:Uncharacterized protein n=1 Tax=Brachionus plicatilis TaxID=10195 RepID=A0A3M7S0T8_BRAPC|nr:hypothetical protein BpHYR1_035096 [Brachionus plicatilis]